MAVTTTIEPFFDRKLEIVTASLPREHSILLEKIPREDASTIMDYMISLNAEVNPSVNYRKDIIKCLTNNILSMSNLNMFEENYYSYILLDGIHNQRM
jgi:hypothetical protein